MNIQQIKTEFLRVIEHATKGLQGGDWDGLKEWNDLKDRFDAMIPTDNFEWSTWILGSEIEDFRIRLLTELPEHNEDGTMHEPNHFMIQCTRIDSKNKFCIRRLMQIAYNIGQMNAVEYDQKYLDEFAKLRLDKFESYIQY